MESQSVQLSSQSEMLERMVETILEIASPEKVILFGSQAKGTAKEASDYDFLIIETEPFGDNGSRRQEAGRIGWALSKFDVVADILIYSPEEIEQRRHWKNGVVLDALSEGKVLYERT